MKRVFWLVLAMTFIMPNPNGGYSIIGPRGLTIVAPTTNGGAVVIEPPGRAGLFPLPIPPVRLPPVPLPPWHPPGRPAWAYPR